MIDTRSELKRGLVVEAISSLGEARLPVKGGSMVPSLWPGDIVEVRRRSVAEISPGEIVVFERNGLLVTHRVVEKVGGPERTLLVTRGDALRAPDAPVSSEELLGGVTAILRGGRRLEPGLTRWSRAASWLFSRSDLCTRLALRIARVVS
jgi:signal peptidase I